MSKQRIVICIGSSCFARGNDANVRAVEEFLEKNGLKDDAELDLSGGLCTGNCADGPIVIVNDTVYTHVDQGVMLDILKSCFPDCK